MRASSENTVSPRPSITRVSSAERGLRDGGSGRRSDIVRQGMNASDGGGDGCAGQYDGAGGAGETATVQARMDAGEQRVVRGSVGGVAFQALRDEGFGRIVHQRVT